MKSVPFHMRLFIAICLLLPLRVWAQTDTTNVWFANGPSGLLIVQTVVVHPSRPDTLLAGSLGGTVSRSLNRGASWATVGASIADSVMALAVAPSNTTIIYAGTLNRGVYKSTDYGSTWAATGLTGGSVRALAVDPNDVDRVYAGTPDSLVKTTDGGLNWVKANLDSVNVTSVAMDPLMPDTVLVGTDGRGVFRTLNDGATWASVNSGISSSRTGRLAHHPTQSDTVYAATLDAGIFSSVDGGTTWGGTNNGLTTLSLTSLAIAPSEPNVMYVGTANGQVFKTTDHGGIWTDITRNLPGGVPVLALAVPPDSANVVYAGMGGALDSGVQRLKQTGLGAVTLVTTGNGPEGVSAADLSGDGVTDIVVANADENDVSVFLTSSLGAVLTRTDYRAGSGANVTRLADLDGDGDRDLVVGNRVKRTLSVLFNDSTGVFGAPVDLFAGYPVGTVALADFDGDQDVDIASGNGDAGLLLVYRNDGAGSFEAPEEVSVMAGVSDLVAGDFSGDGIPDLAWLNYGDSRLVILTNRGNGTFEVDLGSGIGPGPSHLVAADFDVDGDLDLAMSRSDGQIAVYTNSDGFDRSSPQTYALADTATALVVADLDLDLYPDLLAPRATGEVAALINDGYGVFSSSLSFGTISSVGDAAVADLNSDGQLDIVVATPNLNGLTLFANHVATHIKDPAPPLGVTAEDTQGDLGGNVRISWRRPRIDERTGRALAYRIFRSSSASGTFSEIARVDTSSTRSVDSTFVFRSYVDSNATVGIPYYYAVRTESSSSAFSAASDTVVATSYAQPFFEFSFSDNSPYHVRDTIVTTIRLNLLGHDIQSFSMLLGVDTSAVRLLDQDSLSSGVQPIAVDSALATDARVLQNRIDPLNATRMDFGLGFLPVLNDSLPISIGTFRFIARRATTTLVQVLNDTSAARQTVLTQRSDGALIRPFVPPPSALIFRNFRVPGSIAFQGRDGNLNIPVRLDLTQTSALGTALTTPYVAPNDADLTRSGVQLTLKDDGSFELLQVPPGRYGLFAKAYHYLRGRALNDSVVVTDSVGVRTPVRFKWVAADSSLIVSQLRAGDANNDNRVDLADFGQLAAHFGASGFATGSASWGTDFNGDGVVNLADFALLQSNFGEIGMGSAIAAKPVVLAARVTLDNGQLSVAGAEDVVGVSVDVVTSETIDLSDISTGAFWGASAPMLLSRYIAGPESSTYRLAVVRSDLARGVSGDGVILNLGAMPDARLTRVRLLLSDGTVAWAAGAELPLWHSDVPDHPELFVNYPNPFNPSTTIPFAVPTQTRVALTIYSPLGQRVRDLVHDVLAPGYHQVVWDGRDTAGRLVASGLYLIRLEQDDFSAVQKALLLK